MIGGAASLGQSASLDTLIVHANVDGRVVKPEPARWGKGMF